METRTTSKRNQEEEKADGAEIPPSKKTKPVLDRSDSTAASNTIESSTTVMSFKDEDPLSTVLSRGDFKEDESDDIFSLVLAVSIGEIRKNRKENTRPWQVLCERLKDPDSFIVRLKETSTFVRMAEQNFGFNEKMAHQLDVQALEARLCEVQRWHDKDKVRNTYLGATKMEMATMMGSIFSQGVCHPAKGNFGEVASALYLLFCGDKLRKNKCPQYKEFAVNFSHWMYLVQNQGHERKENVIDTGETFFGKLYSVFSSRNSTNFE